MLGNKYVAGVVGVLLVLVIAYNARYFSSRGRPSSPAENVRQLTKKTPEVKHQRAVSEPVVAPSAKADPGPWKRDPFSLQPKPEKKPGTEAEPDIKLAGIIKRDDRSLALVDGKVYAVGDRIGHSVIQEIRQHSIVILFEGKKREISFEDYKVIKEKKK